MEIKEAIARIEVHMEAHHMGEHPHIHIAEALNLALTALRKEQERQQGCAVCNGDALSQVGVVTKFKTPRIYLCGGNSLPPKNEKFRFCPQCGRELKGDAE